MSNSIRRFLIFAIYLASSGCKSVGPRGEAQAFDLRIRLTRNAWHVGDFSTGSLANLRRHLLCTYPTPSTDLRLDIEADADVSYGDVLSSINHLSLWGYNAMLPGEWGHQRPHQCGNVYAGDMAAETGVIPPYIGNRPAGLYKPRDPSATLVVVDKNGQSSVGVAGSLKRVERNAIPRLLSHISMENGADLIFVVIDYRLPWSMAHAILRTIVDGGHPSFSFGSTNM